MSESNLSELSKKLAEPNNLEAIIEIFGMLPTLRKVLWKIVKLEQTGALDDALSILYALSSVKGVISDEMVSGIASAADSALTLFSKIGSPEFRRMCEEILGQGSEIANAVIDSLKINKLK